MRTIGAGIVCAACIAGSIIGDMGYMAADVAKTWDWTATFSVIMFIIIAQMDGSKS